MVGRQITERLTVNKEEILKQCELDMGECLREMGDQQKLIGRLRTTGYYDSFVLAEAMGKVAGLRERLDGIEVQLKKLSDGTQRK